MAEWYNVIIYGTLAGTATFVGMYLVLARAEWSRRHSAGLVSYSAGVLLGVGVLHVLPEALELNEQTPAFVLLAFVLFYFP